MRNLNATLFESYVVLSLKTLCSVKLSRLLYSQYKKHALDAIKNLAIELQRKRALIILFGSFKNKS